MEFLEDWVGLGRPGPEEQLGTHFGETLKELEKLTHYLLCTKCEELPKGKLWTLGCCLHKYCETCKNELLGKECVACGKHGYPKDARPDLFLSSLLAEIPAVYCVLNNLEEKGDVEKNVNDDMDEDTNNGDIGVEGRDMEVPADPFEDSFPIVDATPKAQVAESQDFPEVMEETPQNKAVSRPSFKTMAMRCDTSLPAVRTLAFPSQENEKAKCETVSECDVNAEIRKTPSPPPDLLSDEDLFASPSDLHKKKDVGKPTSPIVPSPERVPILTPYAAGSVNKSAISRKSEENGRKSEESKPPELTPYKKEECTTTVETPKLPTRPTRKSKVQTDSSCTKKTPKPQAQASKKLIEKLGNANGSENVAAAPEPEKKRRKSGPNPSERTRRLSSSSTTSTGRESIDKRNSKGETSLHIVCRGGKLDKVRQLLEEGANVNTKDNAGWTPIHETIAGLKTSRQVEILRLLCEHGADVNALGFNDDTPLHTAAQLGRERLVEVLLEFHASPNIRNDEGKLPKDVTFNEVIVKMLEEKMNPDLLEQGNPNNSTIMSTTSMVEEDPAVMKVMLQKAVLFFVYDVDPEVVKATTEKLGLKVSAKLTQDVTHLIYELSSPEQKKSSRVPLSYEYLFGVSLNMWQLSSDWITKSLKNGSCVVPTSYEILGHDQEVDLNNEDIIPQLTRINRENGNPKLLNGFMFYLYKTCGYESPQIKLDKKQLTHLIALAGGIVTNREPDPDILASEVGRSADRFHVLHNSRGDDSEYTTEKFSITTHFILYDDKAIPPANKRHTLEHIKTLSSRWVIDSLLNFKLEDPEKYL